VNSDIAVCEPQILTGGQLLSSHADEIWALDEGAIIVFESAPKRGRGTMALIWRLAVVLALLMASSARADDTPSAAELQKLFGQKQMEILRHAMSVEAILLEQEAGRFGCGASPLCSHPVRLRRELPPAMREMLRTLIVNPANYRRDSVIGRVAKACGFDPGAAFRFTDDRSRSVDVLVCLHCEDLKIDAGRSSLSAPTDIQTIAPAIVRMLKQLFPEDAVVRSLSERYPHVPRRR
jgi:hypothetical protein